jgi:hypothetical protein
MSRLLNRLFPPPPAPADWVVPVSDESFTAKLTSCISGAYFHAQFAVRLTGTASALVPNQRAWLRHRLVCEAQAVSQQMSVALIESAEIMINARLQGLPWTELTSVRKMSAVVHLTATVVDRKTAAEWESLRTRLALSEMNAKLELERLRHLREDIFKQPEVARTYWLDRHPDAVTEALSNHFELIAEKLGSGPVPETMTIADLLRDFLTDLPPEQKATLLDLVRRAFIANGRQGLADQLPQDLP